MPVEDPWPVEIIEPCSCDKAKDTLANFLPPCSKPAIDEPAADGAHEHERGRDDGSPGNVRARPPFHHVANLEKVCGLALRA